MSICMIPVRMVSLEVTFWAGGMFVFIFLINIAYANKVNRISNAYNQAFISLSTYVTLLTQNKKFFKATESRGVFTNTVLNKIKEVQTKSWDVNFIDIILKTFTTMSGMAFVIMVFLFHKMLNINISELILLLLVFNRLSPQFSSLSGNYTRLSERIPIHFSVKNRIKALKKNLEITGRKKFETLNSIRFEDINFAYKNNKMVLKKVNLEINPLSSIAIVGGSGAGKSTLLDLFLGLIKPTSGTIHYGDIHHEEIDIKTLRGKVAYVSQETTLLDGSLLYNLTITNPDANEAEIKDVCKKAKLDNLISNLPEGLETEVGENGIKLSGGQRQRVALGRALMARPKILILDEATSQLDSETERFIQQAIKELHKKLTIIIVAHRLSTVKFSDNVYVLEKGEIVEQGTYSDLLKQRGRLYELDLLQHV